MDCIRNCIEIDMFTAKCACKPYGVLECTPITGGSRYQTDDTKKDIVLKAIRDNIALNGEPILLKMIKVLESMSHSCQLATELKGIHIIIKTTYVYNYIYRHLCKYLADAFKRHNTG